MKAKKALKRLNRVDKMLAGIIEGFSGAESHVRDFLHSAKTSLGSARAAMKPTQKKDAKAAPAKPAAESKPAPAKAAAPVKVKKPAPKPPAKPQPKPKPKPTPRPKPKPKAAPPKRKPLPPKRANKPAPPTTKRKAEHPFTRVPAEGPSPENTPSPELETPGVPDPPGESPDTAVAEVGHHEHLPPQE